MRYERLLEPVSEDDPSGPDLEETGDEDFSNYYFAADSRIPESFFAKSDAKDVEAEKVNLAEEVKAIGELLDRSRDLRLITLEARFHVFFGQIVGFVDCLEAIAGLLATFWETVHPRAIDGDFSFRRDTIEALDDLSQVIIPFQHLPLIRDKRLGGIATRQFLLGSGAIQPREGEDPADLDRIMERLGDAENTAAVEAAHALIARALAALKAVRSAFGEAVGYEEAPHFDKLTRLLNQAREPLERALPNLKPEGAAAADGAGDATAADGGVAATGGPAPVTAGATAISNHAEANAALLAAETYFAQREPSAPALILVHQARSLIGKPLVQALDALLPETAENAVIKFDHGFRFQIAMSHMRTLTETAAVAAAEDGAEEPKAFSATTRNEAAGLMAGVEAFFRTAEPSSPIPMLLGKARLWLNRDFTMILNELIKKEE